MTIQLLFKVHLRRSLSNDFSLQCSLMCRKCCLLNTEFAGKADNFYVRVHPYLTGFTLGVYAYLPRRRSGLLTQAGYSSSGCLNEYGALKAALIR